MIGKTRAAASHAIANSESAAVASRLNNDARAGVAERNRLVELRLNLLQSREDTFRLHLAQNLLHLIGHLQSLANKALLGKCGEHALRPRAYETRDRLYDRTIRLTQRGWHLGEPHLPRLK